jgi:transposase
VAVVMIGVDPHKGSHTAVAADGDEAVLGLVRVRASAVQAQRLLEWAAQWPARTWAVEGAAGLGHLLAQRLLAAGEQVLDVQPKLAAMSHRVTPGRPRVPVATNGQMARCQSGEPGSTAGQRP